VECSISDRSLEGGRRLDEIVRFNASRGAYGPGPSDDFIAERIASLLNDDEPIRLRISRPARDRDPIGAPARRRHCDDVYDVTQTVDAEEALAAANERLERRVQERTFELEQLNTELERAKIAADRPTCRRRDFWPRRATIFSNP